MSAPPSDHTRCLADAIHQVCELRGRCPRWANAAALRAIFRGRGALGTWQTPVGMIFRDLRAFRRYDGPTEVHKYAIARDGLLR